MGNKAERCTGASGQSGILPGTRCSPRCYDPGTRGVASGTRRAEGALTAVLQTTMISQVLKAFSHHQRLQGAAVHQLLPLEDVLVQEDPAYLRDQQTRVTRSSAPHTWEDTAQVKPCPRSELPRLRTPLGSLAGNLRLQPLRLHLCPRSPSGPAPRRPLLNGHGRPPPCVSLQYSIMF